MNDYDNQTDACTEEERQRDERIRALSHTEMLKQPPDVRMRWFYLFQVGHRELNAAVMSLMELLEQDNEVKIISVIGMTGIGKTTLATQILGKLMARYATSALPHHHSVVYVRAPANGEKSISWKTLYRRMLIAGNEPSVDLKRLTPVSPGEERSLKGTRHSVAHMREMVEAMLLHRKVKVLVIDEALHLLRFDAYAAIMDTLKSLADVASTKLLLIGTYQIADLMIEYAQVARRSEIIHYRRYKVSPSPTSELTEDEAEYIRQLEKFQRNWPCVKAPNLASIWRPLMLSSLGSIGLTKAILLRLASLQMSTEGELLLKSHLGKAIKGPSSLRVIEEETAEGESKLEGACYGDGTVDDDLELPMLEGEALHA
jgi:hypothetical protein